MKNTKHMEIMTMHPVTHQLVFSVDDKGKYEFGDLPPSVAIATLEGYGHLGDNEVYRDAALEYFKGMNQ